MRIPIISRAVSLRGLSLRCRRYERKGGLENPRNTLSLRERPHTGHHEAKVKGWCWRRAGPFREEESLALSEPANPSETPGLGVTRGLPAQQSSHLAQPRSHAADFWGTQRAQRAWPLDPWYSQSSSRRRPCTCCCSARKRLSCWDASTRAN